MNKKPKTLAEAIEIIEELRAQINLMTAGRSTVTDKYTLMDPENLRALVTKCGGDPDDIVAGHHSRGRSNAMRNWLRERDIARGKKGPPPKKMTEKEAAAQHKRDIAAIRNADLGNGKPKKTSVTVKGKRQAAELTNKARKAEKARSRTGRSMG